MTGVQGVRPGLGVALGRGAATHAHLGSTRVGISAMKEISEGV